MVRKTPKLYASEFFASMILKITKNVVDTFSKIEYDDN